MNQFRPLHELAAEKLSAQIRAETSIFHHPPEGRTQNAAFNPFTGKAYRGISALYLNLQPFNDPRWLTLKQARMMHAKIPKGTSGTRIIFYKTTERKAVLDGNGQQKLDAEGKKMYQTLRLDKPVNETAWVFNAAQLKGIPSLEKSLEKHALVPVDAVQRVLEMLTGSGAKIAYGGKEAFYNADTDMIQLPQTEDFRRPSQYASVAIYELSHRAVQQMGKSDLDTKTSEGQTLKEEIRAAIASAFLYRQLDIREPLPVMQDQMENWAEFLEKNPFELQLATIDAQRVFDFLNGLEVRATIQEQKTETAAKKLTLDDEISHEQGRYKVTCIHSKNSNVQVENLDTGARTKLKPSDGLYQSLIEAKYHQQQSVLPQAAVISEVQTIQRSALRR